MHLEKCHKQNPCVISYFRRPLLTLSDLRHAFSLGMANRLIVVVRQLSLDDAPFDPSDGDVEGYNYERLKYVCRVSRQMREGQSLHANHISICLNHDSFSALHTPKSKIIF